MVLLVLFLHKDTVQTLREFWSNSLVYSHGAILTPFVFIVAGLSLAKEQLIKQPAILNALALLIASLTLHVAAVTDVMIVQMALLPVVVWFGALLLFGTVAVARLIWLFAVLVFSWPVWDVMIGPLQSLTVWATNHSMDLLQRTAYVDAETVHLRHGSFIIERGCAGLNYFMSAAMIGGIYAHWFARSVQYRAAILLFSLALAVVANWIRVVVIVMAGDLTAMQSSLVEEHTLLGEIVFYACILPIFLFREKSQKAESGRSTETETTFESTAARNWRKATVVVALALIVPATLLYLLQTRMTLADTASIDLPDALEQARVSRITVADDLGAEFASASGVLRRAYQSGDSDIVVALYSHDLGRENVELAAFDNRWFDASRFEGAGLNSEIAVSGWFLGGPSVIELNHREFGTKYVLIGAYLIAGKWTSSSLGAKLLRLLALINGEAEAAAVSVAVKCADSCDATLQRQGPTVVEILDRIRRASVSESEIP